HPADRMVRRPYRCARCLARARLGSAERGFRARYEGICTARRGPARGGSGDGAMTTWRGVADALFPGGHRIEEKGDLLYGEGRAGGKVFAVIGTTNHAEVGVELALAMA